MKFDYDAHKSQSNKIKHGIDFMQAQRLWTDRNIAMVASNQTTDEDRFLFIGTIDGKHWTAITTQRDLDVIRIISVRRSRKQEVELYEG